MAKRKWGEVQTMLGFRGPHKVDKRLGFVDATRMHISLTDGPGFFKSSGLDLDRMRIGRIEDGKRYLGNNCWQHVNVEESRLNEWD
jgi:hypothetical protein